MGYSSPTLLWLPSLFTYAPSTDPPSRRRCGNGLLTHILIAEGYTGVGIDLRARVSWSHYPKPTQAALHVEAINPTVYATSSSTQGSEHDLPQPSADDEPSTSPSPPNSAPKSRLPKGCFIIGNHADELTPWIPVLSTLCDASGYLSIPCCAWVFDAKYERSRNTPYPIPLNIPSSDPTSSDVAAAAGTDCHIDKSTIVSKSDGPELDPPSQKDLLNRFADSLHLGGDATNSNSSSYSMYRIWLASLSVHCGWIVECETLRIPSTRNWAIVGAV